MRSDECTPRLYIDLLILSAGLGGGLTFVKELIPGVIKELQRKLDIVIMAWVAKFWKTAPAASNAIEVFGRRSRLCWRKLWQTGLKNMWRPTP